MSGPTSGDPATADKRTLVIAAVVMVALVLVGVGSAAVFNRSACASIDPEPVPLGATGSVDEVLAAAFPETEDADREAMAAALATLSDRLGPITGAAEVTGADALAPTADGVAALGAVTTVLNDRGSEALARVDVGEGRVTGSGDTLYAVAVANELTGQIDAAVPLDGDLDPDTCVDTALANTPLAFALDAADGELLLLRIDEAGQEPELELRDAVEGRVWGPPLDIGLAQPGVQGERLTGGLGPDLAVTGRRTELAAPEPVLTAVDRDAGDIVWTVGRDDLGGLLATDVPQVVEVLAVGRDLVLVGLSVDAVVEEPLPRAAEVPTRLVAVDPVDGSVLWDAPLAPGDIVRHATVQDRRTWVAVASEDDTIRFQGRDDAGTTTQESQASGADGRVTILADGSAVGVTTEAVTVVADGEVVALASELVGRDVMSHDGSVTLLFGGPDGGSVAITFEG